MKVTEITELILMPMSWLVSKSLATARMAMPTLVWLMSWVRATTRATTRKGVTTVTTLVVVPKMVMCLRQDGQGGVHLGQAAGDVSGDVLEEIAHADGGDHDAHPGGGAQGLVGRPFDEKAQDHREKDHQGHGHRQGQAGAEVDHDEAGHHEHVAVGEVDEAQDTVDHGVADGDQGVLSAQGYAGEQDGDCVLH